MPTITADSTKQAVPRVPGVLCVDLDGTLVSTDMVWECVILLLKQSPLSTFLLPFWLLRGKAYFKRQLAQRTTLRIETLPYRSDVLEYVRRARQSGRTTVLATAADEEIAEQVSEHLDVFDRVIASDGQTNLKGMRKANRLVDEFGEKGFAYAGDSRSDKTVWQHAGASVVVGSENRARAAAARSPLERKFDGSVSRPYKVLKLLRLHHWSKNALLLLPVLLAHRIAPAPIARVLLGMVLFGVAASSIYILNDLLDLESDRAHPWKSKRPIASGEVPIPLALGAFAILLPTAITLMWTLVGTAAATLTLTYCALSITYSFLLKRIVLADIFVLTSFYLMRLVIGAVVARVPLSAWFLVFSLFFFLSLALAKRYSELVSSERLVRSGNSGRGYRTEDRELLALMGVASGFSAIVILSLYTQSADVMVLYYRPQFLLMLCPLVLYWTSRIWLKAHRGEMNEDPVTLSMRDPVSYSVGLVAIGIVLLAALRF